MVVELLKKNAEYALENGEAKIVTPEKFFISLMADTPKGLNDTSCLLHKEIQKEEYELTLVRCENPEEFKVINQNTPIGLTHTITETFKR